MPVYDYSYRTWQGERSGPMLRWLAIPKFTFMGLFGKRMFVWLFGLAWVQFLLRVAYIYVLVNTEFLTSLGIPRQAFPQVLPQVGAFFFRNLIESQMIFCVLLLFVVGADLISRDLVHRAFVLYASKPISRWEYFLGKFLTLFILMMLLTWFQAAVLYVLQIAVSPPGSDWRVHFWRDYAGIFFAITVYSTIVSAGLSLIVLAASSLAKNGRYAGMGLVVYVFGATVVAGIVRHVLDNRDALALSPFLSVVELGMRLFNIGAHGTGGIVTTMSLGACLTGVVGVFAGSSLILWWRLRSAARYGA